MKHWPFKIIDKETKPIIEVEYRGEAKQFTPEEISSMILLKMKETAEAYLGTTVVNAGSFFLVVLLLSHVFFGATILTLS